MRHIRPNRGTPEPNDFDRLINLIKGALTIAGAASAVAHPVLSSAFPIATEALSQLQNAFAQRRSKELLDEVTEDLYFAQKDGQLTDEQIKQVISSEQFNSALLEARLIVTRTHQEEKLEALRNAVLNTALSKVPDDNRRAAFLSLIDRFTSAHLRILSRLNTPQNYEQWRQPMPLQKPYENLRTPVAWVKEFVGEFACEDESFIKMLIDDLERAGLIGMKGDDPYIPRAFDWMTAFGHDFLTFISKPTIAAQKIISKEPPSVVA